MTKKHIVSIIAEFDSTKSLIHAATQTRKKGYKHFEVYSPFPIHGMDAAMGIPASKLPWIVLLCGATGLSVGLGLQTWVATSAYKLTISGKPFFSYQAFVPVTFELMVLFSAFGTVFGMLALNKLPQWYNALFKTENFHKVTSHGFFLEIQNKNDQLDVESSSAFLSSIGGENIEVVSE